MNYLASLFSTETITEEQAAKVSGLMHIAGDIEHIGDHCKNVAEFQALAKSTGHNNMRQLFSEYGKVSMEESLDILLEIQNRIFNEQISNKENDIVSALAKYYGEEHAFKLKKLCDVNRGLI